MPDLSVATNAAAPQQAIQQLKIGDRVATPTSDGKVQLTSPDGSSVKMEIDKFKQYLIEHQKEVSITNPIGDTTSFKSRENAEEAEPKKRGMSTLSKLIILAGLVGVGIWQRKNISEYWKKAVDFVKGLKGKASADVLEPEVKSAV
ncbi:MAG: hypothetical protein WCY19_06455 [Candidatus Gastranaerophilaceae bacterium]